MRIECATEVSIEHIADIFKMECVHQITKVQTGEWKGETIVVDVWDWKPSVAQFNQYDAFPGDWICKTDGGWKVLTAVEYKKYKEGQE